MNNQRSMTAVDAAQSGAAALDDTAEIATPSALRPNRELVWNATWLPAALVLAPIFALFVWYAIQHAFLCDDAFISFRYAQNLVLGRGLVYNVGERVEGYTNFLWVVELAAIWKLFALRPEISSFLLSGLYTIGTIGVTGALALSTPFRRERKAALYASMLFLAINRNFAVWTTSGLETRQFTFFLILGFWLLQRAPQPNTLQRYIPASFALGAAALTRPEGLLFFACAGLWLLIGSAQTQRLIVREWAGFLAPFGLIVAAHLAFRLAYYGDFVPNTYYAKDVRAWPEAGFSYVVTAIIENGLYLILPMAALGMLARFGIARDGLHGLSAICIVLHLAYLVRIGGDHFEFRPFDFYWPLLSVATADGLLLLRAAAQRWLANKTPTHAVAGSWFLAGSLTCVLIVYSTVLQIAHVTLTYDLSTAEDVAQLAAKVDKQSFPMAFLLPGMQSLTEIYNPALEFTAKHRVGARFQEHKATWQIYYGLSSAYIGKTAGLFPPDAVMRILMAGILPYCLPELTMIDALGLNDRTIAHNPVTTPNRFRQLAHDRSAPPGYMQSRGVNLEVLYAHHSFGPDAEYALRLEDRLWMPLRSPNPEWLRGAFAARGLWWKHLDPSLFKNQVWIAGKPFVPTRELGFFDQRDLDGWTAVGSNMLIDPADNTLPNKVRPWGHIGNGLVDSFAPIEMDAAFGSMTSPKFSPVAGEHLAFLVGGGSGPKVGVEVRADGDLIATFRGDDSETLSFVELDLTAQAAKSCQIVIYDGATGPWGHIMADHFMLVR